MVWSSDMIMAISFTIPKVSQSGGSSVGAQGNCTIAFAVLGLGLAGGFSTLCYYGWGLGNACWHCMLG